MVEPIIKVEHLSKQYRLGEAEPYLSLRDIIASKFNPARWFRQRQQHDSFWALDDVNFTVQPGEVLGVVGRNGAGKSTLLKIISQITPPTKGSITLHGRVVSLLEVGTGFHPELTGRENIYLNGALLGMTTTEIKRKFDAIVDFSEVEQFLDTPVKRYSSGMYVRLAFAVAAHLDPEILIVDEVLAVGDAQFQKKCLDKMQDVASGGRTVVFVSHNMNAIRSLCQKAVLLEHGKMVAWGPVNEVVNQYLHTGGSQPAERTFTVKPGTEPVSPKAVRVQHVDGKNGDTYQINESIQLACDYVCHEAIADVHVQFFIYDEKGACVFMTADNLTKNQQNWTHQAGTYRTTVTIPANLLAESRYSVKLSLGNLNRKTKYYVEPDCLAFAVVDPMDGTTVRGNWAGNWDGVVRPLLPWKVTQLP